MPFIKRDTQGRIRSVSLERQEGYTECAERDIPELDTYLQLIDEAKTEISGTDKPLVRVIEDLIDLLVKRDVIRFTDLPQPAQNKLMTRRRLRTEMKPGLDLLDDSEDSTL
jgi:hypothetical protein